MKEKRNNDRAQVFWLLHGQNKRTQTQIPCGYIIDLSETGIKLWIDNNREINNGEFEIDIHPNKSLKMDSLTLTIQKARIYPNKVSHFHEVGGTIKDISEDEKSKLLVLIQSLRENQHARCEIRL